MSASLTNVSWIERVWPAGSRPGKILAFMPIGNCMVSPIGMRVLWPGETVLLVDDETVNFVLSFISLPGVLASGARRRKRIVCWNCLCFVLSGIQDSKSCDIKWRSVVGVEVRVVFAFSLAYVVRSEGVAVVSSNEIGSDDFFPILTIISISLLMSGTIVNVGNAKAHLLASRWR